jgi:ubiquinone/menaquinone biosynthesis C-methylase UbiE
MRRRPWVNYDKIAHLYDTQHYRVRSTDPQLFSFAGERYAADLAVLDIGCGTGN